MGKLDKEKEEIGWIKFWIGVSVASIMGLISWFVNHYADANSIILIMDLLATVVLAVFIVVLNRTALRKIKELEAL
jgi:F0F1-type ATP synthase assembly protein I